MNLFIAEKRTLGYIISENIGIKQKKDGYIECNGNNVVTWCFGHLLELAPPNFYITGSFKEKKGWKKEDLPIIPNKWVRCVKKGAKKQLEVIKSLISKADIIINAGDPDREGQLLVDEIFDYLNIKGKPIKRIWLQALDSQNVKKALRNIEDNDKYLTYRLSADARSKADWLIGMNFSRYFTLSSGARKVISVGRVQTPTLALIAERDKKIKQFKPHDYFIVKADLNKDNHSFTSTLSLPDDSKGLDEEGRLIDKDMAVKVANATKEQYATVINFTKTKKTENPPLPFMLSSLQKFASSKYGLTAKQVLNIAQSLYEKKLTTYPRTDCSYIAEEQHKDAGKILNSLNSVLSKIIPNCDKSIKHIAFNSSKITAHTAIIPTGDISAYSKLNNEEKKVFLDIAQRYACLFLPPYIYYSVRADFDISGYIFKSNGNQIISLGFRQYCFQKDNKTVLPDLKKGESLYNANSTIKIATTTPPMHFTDGTIIDAMSHIYRYIEDESVKKILKETDGIGTEATRANIIELLIKRGFLSRNGKSITVTPLGENLISQLPDWIKNPALTANWERGLNMILNGTFKYDDFLSKQISFIRKKIKENVEINIDKNKTDKSAGRCSCGGNVMETPKTYRCDKCGKYVFKVVAGRKLTVNQVLSLMQGKQIKVNGLRSKKGKKFGANLKLMLDGDKWKINMSFE